MRWRSANPPVLQAKYTMTSARGQKNAISFCTKNRIRLYTDHAKDVEQCDFHLLFVFIITIIGKITLKSSHVF